MKKSNTLTTSLVLLTATASTALAILAVIARQSRTSNFNHAIKRYEEFNNTFSKYKENFNLDQQQSTELQKQTDLAKFVLTNPDSTALQKFLALNKIGNYQLGIINNWANAQLENGFLDKKLKEYKELLEGQISRLREIDLRSQFDSIESVNFKNLFDRFSTLTKEQKKARINNFNTLLVNKINEQYNLIATHLLEQNNTLDDNVVSLIQKYPTLALRNEVMQNVFQIENDILDKRFRINNIAVNKTYIENKLLDSGSQNTQFVQKYNAILIEMNNVVNGNFKNVFDNTFSLLPDKLKLNSEVNNEIDILKSKISDTNSALVNRELFDKLTSLLLKYKLISSKNLNKHLALKSISNYLSLSDYFLNTSTLKIQAATTTNDLEDALDNLKTFKNMLDSSNLTNKQIIDDHLSFVKAFPSTVFVNLEQKFKQDKTFFDLINTKDVDQINKQQLIELVSRLRNSLNTLRNLDLKFKVANEHFRRIANTTSIEFPNPLLLQSELNEFNEFIILSGKSSVDLDNLVLNVNNKIDSVSTLIETRSEFRNLSNQINSTILNLNDFSQPLKEIYLNKKVIQLATDLQNRILSLNIFANLDKNKIVLYKYNAREQLRSLQKIELNFLHSKSIEQLAKLNKNKVTNFEQLVKKINYVATILNNQDLRPLNLNYELLEQKLNDLNKKVKREISLQFNPIISDKILKLIKEYKFLINALETAIVQDEATLNLYKAIEYTYDSFNPTNDENYQPSQYEINQINKLITANKSLNTQNKKTNELLSLDKVDNEESNLYNQKFLKSINETNNTAQHTQDIVKQIDDVRKIIADLDKSKQEIEQDSEIKDNFREDFEQIEQIKSKIAHELAQNPVDIDKISQLSKQAKDLLNNINEKRKDGFLNQRLDKIKEAIDEAFGDNNQTHSPGEDALRTRLNDLYKQAQHPTLSREQKEQLLAKADKLSQSINFVKQIENKLNEYDADAEKYNLDPERKSRVPEAILEANTVKDSINTLFVALGTSDNLPDVDKLDDALKQIDQEKTKLDLAYNHDKIEFVNDKINDKKYKVDASTPHRLKNELNTIIEQIDKYSKQKIASDALPDTVDALEKLNRENDLISVVKNAISTYDDIKNDPNLDDNDSIIDANQLQEVILQNLPNLTQDPLDTVEVIENKKQAIEKAIKIAQAKNKLRKTIINQLPDVLNDAEQNRDLLKEIKDGVNEAKKQYQNILDAPNNAYEAEFIEQKNEELQQKIQELNSKKQELLKTYDEAKASAEAIRKEYDKKAFIGSKAPDGENFNNYINARDEYLAGLQNVDKSTIATLAAAEIAMKKAYNKDVVENAIDKYKKFVREQIDSVNDENIGSVKELSTEFSDYVDGLLSSANGIDTEEQALQISKQTQAMKNYNDTQKDIVDAIEQYKELAKENPNDNDITKGIQQLKALLNKNIFPTSPFSVSDISTKNDELIAQITQIKEEIGKRSLNKKLANELIDHAENFSKLSTKINPDRVKADEVIEQIFNGSKDLGNSVDPEFRKLTENILNEIKTLNTKTLDKNQLAKIKNKLDVIDETKQYSDALSLIVGSAQTLKEENLTNTSSIVVSVIDRDLNPLITEAQNLYANSISLDEDKNDASVARIREAYIEKIKEIEAAKDRLKQALEIDALIKKTISLSDEVNYFELNGVNGEDNLQKARNWLQSITDSTAIENGLNNQQKNDKLTQGLQKANNANKFIVEQKLISDTIEQWKQQRELDTNSKYEATIKDEQNLIKAMWDNLPQASENLDPTAIHTRLNNIELALMTQSNNRAKRIETIDKIKEFEDSQLYTNTAQYPKLLASLRTKVKKLYTDNANANNVGEMQLVQDELTQLKDFIVKQTLLAQKIEEFSTYADSVSPSTNDIAAKKTLLTDEIKKAEQMYTEDIPSVQNISQRKTAIVNQIRQLTLHEARLRVYVELGKVQSNIKNDSNINTNEKTYLENKLRQLSAELEAIEFDANTDPNVFTNLENKYLKGQSENSIPYVFEKVKELSIAYRDAQKVNILKQSGLSSQLDSQEVVQAFNNLNNSIDQAIEINKEPSTTNNARNEKITELNKLSIAVVNAKKLSLTKLASNANNLYVVLNQANNNATDAIENTFKQNSIDDLNNYQIDVQSTQEQTIVKMNELLQKGLDTFRAQVEKAFETQSAKLNDQLANLQSYIDNILLNSIWKQSTLGKFNTLTNTTSELKTFINSKTSLTNQLKQFSLIDVTVPFTQAYLNENIDLINRAKSAISEFKTAINNDFDQLFAANTGELNQLSVLFDKGLVTSQTNSASMTLFIQLGFNDTNSQYLTLKTNLNDFTNRLNTIKSNQNTTQLQSDIQEANELLNSFGTLISTLKNEANLLLSQRQNLNEIWQYLFKSGKESAASSISTDYQNQWNPLNGKNNSIILHTKDDFIKQSYVFENSSAIDSVITQTKTFVDYVNNTALNNKYMNLLHNINPIVKNSIIYEEFNKNLEKLTSTLQSQDDKLDITNNDSFLSMFDNFGDTKIDTVSNFNPIYFKVYLVKEASQNQWLSKKSSNTAQKVYQAKIRYEYKPDNLNSFSNYTGFSFDVNRDLTFKTKDNLSLESGTSSIFFKDYNINSLGYNSKQIIGNAEELGWDDVTTRELASQKVLDTFKKALGINEGNKQLVLYHTRNAQNQIQKHFGIVENNKFSEITQNSDNFNIKFLFPQFYIYQQSTQIKSDSDLQALNISVQGNEIVINAAIPSNLLVGSENFSANSNTIVVSNGVIEDQKTMPDVILNRIRIGVDFDSATKNISLFLTHHESFNVTKQRSLHDPLITPTFTYTDTNNSTAYVWSNTDFAKYMAIHTDIWDNKNANNTSILAQPANGTNPSNTYQGYTPNHTEPGYEKYIIKNHRSANIYIYTTNVQGDSIKNTSTLSSSSTLDLSVLYNTGVIEFNFKDLKN
ncbi:hypothetical protein EG856_00470 [Mycoplasmopsis phocirhinis]|uniref:Uncharacterized protein n=1 Tax=Mycoplasmopsis phocirhinis TaxID=142650 RepID=A0A4P6MNF1_9BACT|nr:hypothetical protein [Mycoplasmopsis phocirhinis]QBF34410.1 hypothetical protein EG856_00470 [Mycoplasmopsis phocirhinis]